MKHYRWFDFKDELLNHNLKIGKGELCSASCGRISTGSDGFMNPFYAGAVASRNLNWGREEIFEKIRKEEFPKCPSRRDTLWLFADNVLANRKGKEWGFIEQGRELLEVEIIASLNSFKADSKWIDCNSSQYLKNARQYWSGKMTANPEPEILFDGKIKVLNYDWQTKCKLLS